MDSKSKKLLFIYNPTAGRGTIKPHIHDLVNTFTEAGYIVTIHPTQSALDGPRFIWEHAAEFDVIAISGGDGTLHECVNALMTVPRDSRPAIGYIPAGSTNDFAVAHDISFNIPKAAEEITAGYPTVYDLGQLGSYYFTYVAAFGIFTDVTYDTPQELKNTFGYLAYIFEGASRLSTYKPQHITVWADGEIIEDDFLLGMVTNSTCVGGIKIRREDISLHDGKSELFLVKNSSRPIDFIELMASIARGDYSSPILIHRQVTNAAFESERPIVWTMDGEYGGSYESIRAHTCKDAIALMKKEEVIV